MAAGISTDILNETLAGNVRSKREWAAELNRQAEERMAEARALRAQALMAVAEADSLECLIISPERIIVLVCDTFNIPVAVLLSKCRTQKVAFARQIAFYILHERFKFSSSETGKKLNKNHSTVLHGCAMIAARMGDLSRVEKLVDKIEKAVRGQDGVTVVEDSTGVAA